MPKSKQQFTVIVVFIQSMQERDLVLLAEKSCHDC